jgi:hypothetical protein
MAINVTCPGCLTRFTVGDKFAGKQGPCPKCKEIITIPKPSDEVVIHSPEHSEAGAIGAGGRHALKTYKRQDTKFKPLVFSAVAGIVLLTLLGAIVLRGDTLSNELKTIAMIAGAIVLGPPIAWAGYTFLRDAELDSYRGTAALIRAVICGLVFALGWGIYWYAGTQWNGPDAFAKGLQIYQVLILIAIPIGIGTFASTMSFDLEPFNGFFLCAMYFAITVVLRLVAGMPALPGLVLGT